MVVALWRFCFPCPPPRPASYRESYAPSTKHLTIAKHVHFLRARIVRHDYKSGTLRTQKHNVRFFGRLSIFSWLSGSMVGGGKKAVIAGQGASRLRPRQSARHAAANVTSLPTIGITLLLKSIYIYIYTHIRRLLCIYKFIAMDSLGQVMSSNPFATTKRFRITQDECKR